MTSSEATGSHDAGGLEPGRILGGRYEIVGVLDDATGGMGAVYRCLDQRLQRPVVIKTIRSALLASDDREIVLQRFKAEALTAASLQHPNIVDVLDYCNEPGEPLFYVMPLVDGCVSLKRRVDAFAEQSSFLPLDELLQIALQCAEGLHAAHTRGIIHRDIKPHNLLVAPGIAGPHLTIIDFGVAHLPSNPITRTGVAPGTSQYMAPEALQRLVGGDCPVDHRADLFALGVTLYFAATGVKPFAAVGGDDADEAVFRAICKEEPPAPSSIRPELRIGWDAVILRLMAKDPAVRFAHAEELHATLRQIASLGAVSPAAPQGPILFDPPPSDDDSLSFAAGARRRFSDGFASALSSVGEGTEGAQPAAPEPHSPSARRENGAVDSATVPRPAGEAADAPSEERSASVGPEIEQYRAALRSGSAGRLAALPRATRAALMAAACALAGLMVAALVRGAEAESPTPSEATSALADPRPPGSTITPQDILRDQAQARRHQPVTLPGHPARAAESTDTHRRGSATAQQAGTKAAAAPTSATTGQGIASMAAAAPSTTAVRLASRPSSGLRRPRKGTKGTPRASGREMAESQPPRRHRKDLSKVVHVHEEIAAAQDADADRQKNAAERLGVPTGTTVDAVLVAPVTTSSARSTVPATAELVAPLVLAGKGEVLPAGTRFVGKARAQQDGREAVVLVDFETVVLPDHTERAVHALAMQDNGAVGLAARLRDESRDNAVRGAGSAAREVFESALSYIPGGSTIRRAARAAEAEQPHATRARSATLHVPAGQRFLLHFERAS
jgi:serine/threonine protein kinase